MKKKNKTMPESIKEAIKIHGKDIVRDFRLSNILDDVSGFGDIVASKPILRTILKEGYGTKMLELENEKNYWEVKKIQFASEISKSYGYQQEIVDYIFDSLAYGLGWEKVIPKYKEANQKQEEKKNKKAIPDLEEELNYQKSEYRNLLDTLLIKPEKISAFYPASALTKLELVEGKIRLLSEALKTKDYEWCKREKQKILQAHQKNTASIKRKAYSKVIIASIAVIIGGAYGGSYLSSLGEIDEFKQNIKKGDELVASGLYDQAIDSYKDAYSQYDGFNSDSYKEDAIKKMEEVADKLIEEGQNENASLNTALQTIKSELQLDLPSTDKSILEEKLKTVESQIEEIVENGKETLILNISANNGNLNEEGKKLLDELLQLSPKDYWLNFIKNKEK